MGTDVVEIPSIRPYLNLGRAYFDGGDFSQALLDYNKAIEINPKFTKAITGAGTQTTSKVKLVKAFLIIIKRLN